MPHAVYTVRIEEVGLELDVAAYGQRAAVLRALEELKELKIELPEMVTVAVSIQAGEWRYNTKELAYSRLGESVSASPPRGVYKRLREVALVLAHEVAKLDAPGMPWGTAAVVPGHVLNAVDDVFRSATGKVGYEDWAGRASEVLASHRSRDTRIPR